MKESNKKKLSSLYETFNDAGKSLLSNLEKVKTQKKRTLLKKAFKKVNDTTTKKAKDIKKSLKENKENLSFKDAFLASKDTVKDLKNPKEAALLISAIVVPGGLIAYPLRRLNKYTQKKKALNNDTKQPVQKKKIKKKKRPALKK